MQRPDKLKVIVAGDGQSSEFYYGGKTLATFLPKDNVVAVADAPDNVEAMLEAAYEKAGIYPLCRFHRPRLLQDALTQGLKSAFVIGQSKVVGGTTADIVAIANDEVQAQIWIDAQEKLPRLIWTTATKMAEKPRHSIEFSDWKLDATTDDFTSAQAAKAARQVHFCHGDKALSKPFSLAEKVAAIILQYWKSRLFELSRQMAA